MIKIPKIEKKIEEKYYDNQSKSLKATLEDMSKDTKYDKVTKYLSSNGVLDDKKIKKLIIGNLDNLKSAIIEIGEIDEAKNEGFHKLYDNFTKRKLGKEWAELIGVKVCPYCNRSYIFTLKKSGIRPQYDHYFPKSKYPYLAVSMYNLIPSCAICNNIKLDYNTFDTITNREIFIYPYNDEYGYDFAFQTSYSGDFKAWLGASDDFELEIISKGKKSNELNSKVEITGKILHLSELYTKHKDYVKDIISKTYIYNDDYIKSLLIQYPELFNNIEEVKNLAYMNYTEKEKWGSRVLAKLTYDIMMEFKL